MRILLLLLASFSVLADTIYARIESVNGSNYLHIQNDTPYMVYCYVGSQAGYVEFTIGPKEKSRYYLVIGEYKWGCD